jgi:hypothetical protein
MPSRDYSNRYADFVINGQQTMVPYITLPFKNSDKKYIYKLGQSRLDKVSQQYYGTPYFGWLIMLANPSFGGQEWNISDGSILTIPYPLVASLQDYKNALENHFFYYGR